MAAKPCKSKAPPKTGRPKAVKETLPTAEVVDGMLVLGCKIAEIAAVLGVSEDTIRRTFAGNVAKNRAMLRVTVRQKLMEKVRGGSWPAIKWMCMNYLGHSTAVREKRERAEAIPLQFNPEDLAAMRAAGLVMVEAERARKEQQAEAARDTTLERR